MNGFADTKLAWERQPDASLEIKPLLTELTGQFLPRALFAGLMGVVLGFLAQLVGLTPTMGIAEVIVAATFWSAAAMVPTFRGRPDQMLFWLLLLDGSLLLYQVSIYGAATEAVFFRLAPVLLASVLFVLFGTGRVRQGPFLYLVWIAFNVPALVAANVQGLMTIDGLYVVFAINVLYPLVVYYAVGRMARNSISFHRLCDIIAISMLVLCSVPIMLIPLEMTMRQTDNWAALQYGGRAYHVIGIILLAWPIFVTAFERWRPVMRWFAIGIVLMIFASSFSRGGLIALLLVLGGTAIVGGKQRGKLISSLVAFFAFSLVLGLAFAPDWLNQAAWFWLLRLNVASNFSNEMAFNSAAFFEADRYDIWQMAWSFFENSPFWGHGIGSFPSLVGELTGFQLGYSGAHNLTLTVLVERGLLGFIGLLLIGARLLFLIYQCRAFSVSRTFMVYSFVSFLVFAHSTGVELFLNGGRVVNASVTVYLFLLIAALELWNETSQAGATTLREDAEALEGRLA